MDLAIFGSEGTFYLYRFAHFLAGITWIGILYYFNFVQGSWFKECDASVKTAIPVKNKPFRLCCKFDCVFIIVSYFC